MSQSLLAVTRAFHQRALGNVRRAQRDSAIRRSREPESEVVLRLRTLCYRVKEYSAERVLAEVSQNCARHWHACGDELIGAVLEVVGWLVFVRDCPRSIFQRLQPIVEEGLARNSSTRETALRILYNMVVGLQHRERVQVVQKCGDRLAECFYQHEQCQAEVLRVLCLLPPNELNQSSAQLIFNMLEVRLLGQRSKQGSLLQTSQILKGMQEIATWHRVGASPELGEHIKVLCGLGHRPVEEQAGRLHQLF